jgi:Flp pilus assembly CpaE family ATPase
VAVTLAAELAALGEPTLLVDADTYAASIAQTLGVLDEAPGLAAACRAASTGSLEPQLLARLAPQVSAGLRVLTGIGRASRWPEVGATALEAVWPVARQVARWVVVDCGFCLERDEEISFDTAAPRRNAATFAALEEADVVLAVGAGDPVGLQRLVRGLSELREVVPSATPRVVVTRVRSSAVGSGPQRRIREALGRYAGIEDPVLVPDDRAACDAALLAGRSLTEHAPSSPARRVLADLASGLVTATARAGAQEATEAPSGAMDVTRRRLRGRMTG